MLERRQGAEGDRSLPRQTWRGGQCNSERLSNFEIERLHHQSRSQAAAAGGEYDLCLRFCGFYGVMRRSDGCLLRCV